MTTWLTPAEVAELTAAKLHSLQCTRLAKMGIPFRPNFAGRPLVERAAVPWGTWWQGYQDLGDMDLIHQEARGEAPPEWMIEPKRMKDRPWLDRSAVAEFRTLWESINGAGNWDANPWVWVVEFRRIDHGDVA